MSEINITIEGGKSKRLLTAGKYCNDNIVVTATDSDNYELYGTYVLSMTPEIPYETYFEFNLNAEAFLQMPSQEIGLKKVLITLSLLLMVI